MRRLQIHGRECHRPERVPQPTVLGEDTSHLYGYRDARGAVVVATLVDGVKVRPGHQRRQRLPARKNTNRVADRVSRGGDPITFQRRCEKRVCLTLCLSEREPRPPPTRIGTDLGERRQEPLHAGRIRRHVFSFFAIRSENRNNGW
jgi:hypothetical protein